MNYPFVSLHNLTIDPSLVALIPPYLALYHLVLPIGAEAEGITVVMAHPDNPKLLALLKEILKQEIVPVRAHPPEIREYLYQLYPPANGLSSHQIGYYVDDSRATAYLEKIATTLEAHLIPSASFEALRQLEAVGLKALEWQTGVETLLQQDSSVLLWQGVFPNPQNILVALQGHSPDHQAQHLAMQIAKQTQATLTLLGIAAPMKRHQVQGVGNLLDTTDKAGQHHYRRIQQLEVSGLEGFIKLRQGIPEEQIAHEFLEGNYDLLVIPVETLGQFVMRVLAKIQDWATSPINPVLAVKPVWYSDKAIKPM